MSILTNEVIAAVLGAAVGSAFTYLGAVKLSDRQFRHLQDISKLDSIHAAGRTFIASFSEELAVLKSKLDIPMELDAFLRNGYNTKHKTAICTFEQFVPKSSLPAFRAACEQYHSDERTQEIADSGIKLEEAMFIGYSSVYKDEVPPPRALAIERIEALLKFAKHE